MAMKMIKRFTTETTWVLAAVSIVVIGAWFLYIVLTSITW